MANPGINNLWNISFNGNAYKRPMKPMTDRLLSLYGNNHPYRIRLIVEAAVYSGHNAFVFRGLPVLKVSDWEGYKIGYCAPKGTIVSAVTAATPVIAETQTGIGNPARNDKFREFVQVDEFGKIKTDADGNPLLSAIVVSDIDGTAFGYDESVTTLFVPANGGAQAVYAYNHELEREVGSAVDTATKAITIPANIPYGIFMPPMWQDTRGRFLNFDDTNINSSVKDGRFWVPYVDKTKVTWFGTYSANSDTGVETIGNGYKAVYKEYQFAALESYKDESGSTAVYYLPEAGSLLKSDIYGKFVQQYKKEDVEDADAGTTETVDGNLNGAVTVQTVGKIMTYNNRFPQHLNAGIQQYPGMKLMDFKTNGIPIDLYIFVESILNSNVADAKTAGLIAADNTYADKDDVLAAIQSGAFGMLKIDLDK